MEATEGRGDAGGRVLAGGLTFVLLLVALVAGWTIGGRLSGRSDSVSATPAGSDARATVGTRCLDAVDLGKAGVVSPQEVRFSAGESYVEALYCRSDPSTPGGTGVLVERATTGLDPLVAALTESDQPANVVDGCYPMFRPRVWLWMRTSDGDWVVPRWPTGHCHRLLADTGSVLASVPFQVSQRLP